MLYPIAIEHGDDTQAYAIYVPDLQGCFSACDELDEILPSSKEAIQGHLACLLELGLPIPTASPISRYMLDPNYTGMTWALVDVDVNDYLETKIINIPLPKLLLDKLDDKIKDSSYSQYLSNLISRDLLA